MGTLTAKAAIITGASKGLEASIAERLGAADASGLVHYGSSQPTAEAVVERITKNDAGWITGLTAVVAGGQRH